MTIRQKTTTCIVTLCALTLALAILTWNLLPDAAGAPASKASALHVRVVKTELVHAYKVMRRCTGELSVRRSASPSFERPGRIIALMVDEGRVVKEGEELAKLDTELLENQREAQEARLAQSKARLREMEAGPRVERIAAMEARLSQHKALLAEARMAYERRIGLEAKGFAPKEELDTAKAKMDAAQAAVDATLHELNEMKAGTRTEQIDAQSAIIKELEATLKGIDISLRKCVLHAPFSGTVATRLFDEGAVVEAGRPVLTLLETDFIEARIGVPLRFMDQIEIGASYTLEIDQQLVPAKTIAVLPNLDERTRTATVVLSVNLGTDRRVVVGQLARLRLQETVEADGYWLPTEALVKAQRGLWACYAAVSGEGGWRVGLREVELIHNAGERSFVRGALRQGERIVCSGVRRVIPGQRIRIENLADAR